MILTYSGYIVVVLERGMAMIFGMQKGGPPALRSASYRESSIGPAKLKKTSRANTEMQITVVI
jgi:hypothetical protein